MSESPQNEEVARLWADSQPSIAAYIRSMTGDFHDSQDILQDVAAAVVRKFDAYDRQRPFVAWALGIARYELLAYRRRINIDRVVFDDGAFERISEAFVEMADEVHPMLDALQHCLKRVTGRSRQLLDLRYVEGQAIDAIAQRLGATGTSIRMALLRLRRALQECIEGRLEPRGGGTR